MNRRKEIREKLTNLLKHQTSAKDRVFSQRVVPLWDLSFPVTLVYARDETADVFSREDDALSYTRTLNLFVETRTKLLDDDNVDDKLDEYASEIEDILNSKPNLEDTVASILLTGTEIEADYESEEPIAAVRLEYQVIYRDEPSGV